MGAFLRRYRWLHLWLGVDLALLGLFWLVRRQRAWANALVDHVFGPLERTLGALWDHVPFSGMELVVGLAAAGALAAAVLFVLRLVGSRGRRWQVLYRGALALVCTAVGVYMGFCWLWGIYYYADSFQDRSGVRARAVSVQELAQVTDYFIDHLEETADAVPRDEAGVFSQDWETILASSETVYDQVAQEFPFLDFPARQPKAVYFSKIMSRMNFTGVYCPFTGEANVNVDSPACLLPSTVAHELAHQRGVASEQECNFLAILASTTCGDPVYAYSGWLLGYIHLNNALYRADRALWQEAWSRLPETVQADLAANSAYWAPYQKQVTSQAAQQVYDSFLKSYGEEQGIQSYGTVVDLLVVWYGPLTGS